MKPARSPEYLAWIRTLPCVVCSVTYGIEAAHTGPHGLGQRSSDLSCIPLCRRHHRTGNDSYHRLGRNFGAHHSLDIPAIVKRLNARPLVRVRDGQFIASIDGEHYFLGRAVDGLMPALATLRKLWWRCRLEIPKESAFRRRIA